MSCSRARAKDLALLPPLGYSSDRSRRGCPFRDFGRRRHAATSCRNHSTDGELWIIARHVTPLSHAIPWRRRTKRKHEERRSAPGLCLNTRNRWRPLLAGSVTKRPSKRLRVAEQFQVAEHPGSKHYEVGPPSYREPGGRSCRSSHPVPISSSPAPRALPKCTRCFFDFALFSTLISQVGSTGVSFRVTYRILFNFRLWLGDNFFTGGGPPSLCALSGPSIR